MEKEGLFDEAIEALKTSAGWRWAVPNPEKVHFRVAELYEKKGDFESAARLYEDYNLLGYAAKCYERSRRIDKATLYLLGEGKVKEAVALYEKTERPANIERLIGLSKFDLFTFNHPLARSERVSALMRSHMLYSVRDNFQYALERIRAGEKDVLRHYDWDTKRILGADGRRLDDSDGESLAVQYLTYSLLPAEIEVLCRIAGDSVTAGRFSQAIQQLRMSTESVEGLEWYYLPYYVNLYLVSGQFFKGILVGQNALERLKNREHAEVIGIVSRCYEMVGAFNEAAEWKIRQITESDMKDFNNLVLYQDLARVYLKQGTFAKAAEAFHEYCVGKYKSRYSREDQFVVAQLYLLGGDRGRYTKVMASLVDEYRKKGELPDLARILEAYSFLEEAAQIYVELDRQWRGS